MLGYSICILEPLKSDLVTFIFIRLLYQKLRNNLSSALPLKLQGRFFIINDFIYTKIYRLVLAIFLFPVISSIPSFLMLFRRFFDAMWILLFTWWILVLITIINLTSYTLLVFFAFRTFPRSTFRWSWIWGALCSVLRVLVALFSTSLLLRLCCMFCQKALLFNALLILIWSRIRFSGWMTLTTRFLRITRFPCFRIVPI